MTAVTPQFIQIDAGMLINNLKKMPQPRKNHAISLDSIANQTEMGT